MESRLNPCQCGGKAGIFYCEEDCCGAEPRWIWCLNNCSSEHRDLVLVPEKFGNNGDNRSTETRLQDAIKIWNERNS